MVASVSPQRLLYLITQGLVYNFYFHKSIVKYLYGTIKKDIFLKYERISLNNAGRFRQNG